MKKLVKKILGFLFDKKHEAAVLIGLPCLAIIIAAAVLIPQLESLFFAERSREHQKNSIKPTISVQSSDAAAAPASPKPAAATQAPKKNGKDASVHLTTLSVEKDLYIFVRGEDDQPVQGETFTLDVLYPDGRTGTFDSKTDGTCYLINLAPGSYTVSMHEKEGFKTPESVSGTVLSSANFQKIENVEEVVEVKPISEGLDEIKPNVTEVQEQTVVEYISTEQQNATVSAESPAADNYVRDANGNLTYQYEYHYDDDGFLLYRDGTSSDVKPNIEGGILVGGLRFSEEKKCYETVELFNADNTVAGNWYIDATPITREQAARAGWQTEGDRIYYYANGERLTGLKNIDGRLYHFSNEGIRSNSVGIDVSFYNGTINWNAVKNAGVDFVIIRAGFRGWGSAAIYQDTCFNANIKGAKAAGLKVGVYFYSTAVSKTEAIEEASIVLEWLGGTSLDFPVYLDMEYSGDYPEGRSDLLSPAERVDVVRAFCETIRNSGYRPGIYMTENFLEEQIDYSSVSNYSIWMASFTENNNLPTFDRRYDMWQLTDNGRVAGVNGAVDFNVIR